jgi:predicted aminopeptidase
MNKSGLKIIRWNSFFRILAISVALVTIIGSCSMPYLWQAAQGHFEIMNSSQSIKKILKSGALDSASMQRLRLVDDIKSYAIRELHLPDNKSFTNYSDIERPYPGWNVYAAPELSLEPKTWCYPVAGCVVYHGYFKKKDALHYSEKLISKGYDVYIAPFTAYSTRGWFKDPVLSNHLQYDSIRLAGLIIHELAHQKFYYPDDSRVSESFAVTVERAGVLKWLESLGREDQASEAEKSWEKEDDFINRLFDFKKELESIYMSGMDEKIMLQKKDSILDLTSETLHIDRLKLNNAFFIPVSTYNSLVPDFMALLDSCGGDFGEFYSRIEKRFK